MLKKISLLFFIVVFALSNITLYAEDKLELSPLIEEAIENNPDILAAKKRWEASKLRVPQAKSLDNPTIGIEFEKIPRGTLRFDRVEPDDRMLSISQMFPWFGKLPLKGKIALVESQMFAAEYKNNELEVVNAVKNAYYDLFMNYKEVQLSEKNLILLKGIAKTLEAKYVVGEMTQEDLFKVNLEIARLSNAIANLKRERSAKLTRLNALLNREPESMLGEPELNEPSPLSFEIDSLYRLTLQNQPELLIFSYAIEKNKHAKALAKKSLFPDIMSEITLRGVTSGAIGPWDLMLALSVPLWFWSKQRFEIKEAIVNVEEAKAAYEAMRNKALSETKELAVKLEIAANKINLYKTNLIPILEASINSSLAAFASGKTEVMVLLDSERMLVEARMEYYRALVEYYMNLSGLERAVGINLSEVAK